VSGRIRENAHAAMLKAAYPLVSADRDYIFRSAAGQLRALRAAGENPYFSAPGAHPL
jgi:hypothetical protein